MFAASDNNLQIDRDQIAKQLNLLGYVSGEEVFTRAFLPSDDPRSKEDKGRKGDILDFKKLELWQAEGRGIYLVVNGWGHTNAEIKDCRAIFYEHDNLPKDVQRLLWQSLGLPEPTFQVDTGGKSIHSYWVFDEPIPVDLWKKLQTDLLNFADADRSLKNPSRVMRLAGGYHISAKGASRTFIVSASGNRYSFEHLRKIIPSSQKENHFTSQERSTTSEWAKSYLAALHPSRADNYDDWLLVGMALKSADESLLVEWDNWSQQSSKYQSGVCLQKWNSFKSNGVNIGTLGHLAKQDGWVNPFSKSSHQPNNYKSGSTNKDAENVITHPSFAAMSPKELEEKLDELIHKSLPKSRLEIEIAELAKQSRISDKTIWRIYREKEKELEQIEDRRNTKAEIDQLLEAEQASIDISTIIPEALAKPINLLANRLSLKPECYLTSLLTATSALHKVGTKLIIHETDEFEVTPNIFSGIVAVPSQKKSPIIKSMVTKPLGILRRKAREEHKQALAQFELELAEYENIKDKKERSEKFPCGEPKKPREKVYSFTKTTGEGLINQAQACPEQGLLGVFDELASYFKSSNQYRGGRGSDEEDLLSYYDGTGETVLRADGIRADIDNLLVSILGSIQPEVLQALLKDCNDSNGKWSRLIFVVQPKKEGQMHDDTGSLNITPMLADLYQKIDQLPPTEYRLSRPAFKYFQQVYNALEKKRVAETLPAMEFVWGKSIGRIGKLAINLHVIQAAFNGELPDQFISKDTIIAATKLTYFYSQQVKSLYTEFTDSGKLAPNLAKVIRLSENKQGWIKAKDVQLSISLDKRPKPEEVRNWFTELKAMGKGQTRGEGRHLEFNAKVDESSQSSQIVDKLSTAETTANTSFEPISSQSSQSSQFSTFLNSPTALVEEKEEKLSFLEELTTLTTLDCNIDPEPVSAVDNLSTTPSTLTNLTTFDSKPEEVVDNLSTSPTTFDSKPEEVVDNLSTTSTTSTFDCNIESEPVSAVDNLSTSLTTLDIESEQTPAVDNLSTSSTTLSTESEPVSFSQFEDDGRDISEFIGCKVEVRSFFNSNKVEFIGEMKCWDEKNAVVTVLTSNGEKAAYMSRCFLIR